jgi:HAD superfamily hydrolase (TIGR01549 family)
MVIGSQKPSGGGAAGEVAQRSPRLNHPTESGDDDGGEQRSGGSAVAGGGVQDAGAGRTGGCDRRLDGGEAVVPAPHDNLPAGQTGTMADTAIFDVDGTLVDTNYQHALAWFRAFRRYGITLPMWRIHRGIGMGGDMFVPEVAGRKVEQAHGDDLRKAWVEEFDQLIGEVQPFEGAHELLAEVKERGFRLVLASSGKTQHVEAFLDLIEGKSLADAWTTSDDVAKSKPEPDIVATALAKVEGTSGIMVGDSIFDAQAAAKLKIPVIGVRTGGFSVGELQEAGVLQVFDSLVAFRQALDGTPLARASR